MKQRTLHQITATIIHNTLPFSNYILTINIDLPTKIWHREITKTPKQSIKTDLLHTLARVQEKQGHTRTKQHSSNIRYSLLQISEGLQQIHRQEHSCISTTTTT